MEDKQTNINTDPANLYFAKLKVSLGKNLLQPVLSQKGRLVHNLSIGCQVSEQFKLPEIRNTQSRSKERNRSLEIKPHESRSRLNNSQVSIKR